MVELSPLLVKRVDFTNRVRMRTFKYRLQPSRSQRTKLMQTLEFCRWVYNETLATRKNSWEQEKKVLSLYDTHKLLTLWKKQHPELKVCILRCCRMYRSELIWLSKHFFVG